MVAHGLPAFEQSLLVSFPPTATNRFVAARTGQLFPATETSSVNPSAKHAGMIQTRGADGRLVDSCNLEFSAFVIIAPGWLYPLGNQGKDSRTQLLLLWVCG